MLSDQIRTLGYERGLQAVIKPHHRVLDLGCGTGILSFFAHRAGAARVYAVDRSPFIPAARAVAQANGLDRIQFFQGEDVRLPTPVDVLVSEWMGHFVFNEAMLEPLLRMRDRYLVPGGIMIPRRLSLFAGLVIDPAFFQRYDYFGQRPYGFDWSPLVELSFARTETRNLSPQQVAPTVIPLGALDMATCQQTPAVLSGSAVFDQPLRAHGLVGWFDAELADGVSFGTGPFSPRTHWKQMAFPLSAPFDIVAGQPVRIRIEPVVVEEDRRHWRWQLAQGTRSAGEDEIEAKTRAFLGDAQGPGGPG